MDAVVPAPHRRRSPSLIRLVAGAAAATVLILSLPSPAAAAPTPSVTISDVTVTEGTGAAPVTASFTIQAAPPPKVNSPLQVSWATAPVSASAPGDFTSSSGTVSLTKSASSRVIGVPIVGDATDEPNETFVVNLTTLVGAPGQIGDPQGVGTITDDDAPPTLSVNDVSVAEGNAGTTTAGFTVTLSATSGNAVTFDWATSPGTAAAGTDYITATGSRTIAAGATSATIGVSVNGDSLDEVNETFTVMLSNPAGATIADGSGTGTITDDDPAPSLSIDDVSVTEGSAGTSTATFTVSLGAASAKTVTFDWATAAGTAAAGVDYATASGSRTIAAGATSATIAITVNGDVLDEVNETFTVALSNPANATIADGSGVGTVTDDDAPPTLSVNDVSVTEGNAGTTTATFTVSLSATSGKTVTVAWSTADADAVQPVDYTAGSGTLTFVPGDTSATIGVSVNGDLIAELDEVFDVTLTAPSNATLGDATGVGTITDDELLPVIDIDEPTALEGSGSIVFAVSLSHQSASPVTVEWDTAAGTATNGIDYFDTNGTVTFAPLDTSETVEITVNEDGTFEHDETMAVNLSNASGAPIGDTQGIGTIANDDDAPGLSVGDVSVVEGNTGQKMLTFSVSLTGDTDIDATFDFATAGLSATQGTDYADAGGTMTIDAGDTGATIDVVVNGDATYEVDETLSVTLSDPSSAVLVDGAAVGTIRNDDKAPTTVTVRIARAPTKIVATGVLEHAHAGLRITATLFRKVHGRFVKVTAKTARVRDLRDRDGDGKPDGAYTAKFPRPKSKGLYKVVVRFKGSAAYKPCTRSKVFRLPAK
jgi:large repetitive protein